MKIYNYDRVTKAFTGASDADRSPMEPDKFLIPAFATHIEPPAVDVMQLAVFDPDKSAWSVQGVAPPPLPPEPMPMPPAQRAALLRASAARFANAVAVGWGYDSIDEAVTYAEEPAVPRFQVEGRAFRAWRSVLWHAFDELIAGVDGGTVPVPETDAELQALLPAFVPPGAGEA